MRKNIDPSTWGPPTWDFLDYCAQSIDEESYPSYVALLELLPKILPCESCRHHCANYIQDNPLQDSQMQIGTWLDKFRLNVKQRVGSIKVQSQGSGAICVALVIVLVILLGIGVVLAYRF
jgi:hypothetical protein